ncbi:dTDP-4-dehydrorhamnose 3,5-epimerase [Flavobacterium psychrotrophum]|uniref:dTDP-4-dehydrorhamnose 3,5-epimerase n=1 Tax=Flavobacterium psychrotrophum TaxID=2294119 RepID=UPI000E31955C|nr:dTDP-4-dehydrorhamnose 3,5-epimerase [Flavobacterium psychrotrophum]
MNIVHTHLEGCFILEPRVFNDGRGYFYESYNKKTFDSATGLNVEFVQDNQSFSTRGVLRGLHYQTGDAAQAKLVRVISGTVLDVAVDLRKHSDTFGKYVAVELSSENKKQLFVPRGFAHGFVVLSEEAEFSYKCDNFYSKEHEGGIIYNDKSLAIDWQLSESELVVSEKDIVLPALENAIY